MQCAMRAMLVGLLLIPAIPAADQPKAEKSPTSAEQLQKWKQEFQQAHETFSHAFDKSQSDQERQKLQDEQNKRVRAYVHRAIEFAQNHAKDSAAAEALSWIIEAGSGYWVARAEIAPAFDLLRTDHISSDKLQPACEFAFEYDDASTKPEQFLRAVIEKNPHRAIQARAHYDLARVLRRQAIRAKRMQEEPTKTQRLEPWLGASVLDHLKASDPDKLFQETEKLLQRVLAEHSDVKTPHGTLGEEAKVILYEMHHLVAGKVALEIEGEDLDGKHFKLSDYRGKVVMLDFWGHW